VTGGERARLGQPLLLALGKLGIRSLERSPGGEWLIVAGPTGDVGEAFRLYAWSGAAAPPRLLRTIPAAELRPEAVVAPAPGKLLLLSDDGTDTCKAASPAGRTFRGLEIEETDGNE